MPRSSYANLKSPRSMTPSPLPAPARTTLADCCAVPATCSAVSAAIIKPIAPAPGRRRIQLLLVLDANALLELLGLHGLDRLEVVFPNQRVAVLTRRVLLEDVKWRGDFEGDAESLEHLFHLLLHRRIRFRCRRPF